jgi:hypothetical protein
MFVENQLVERPNPKADAVKIPSNALRRTTQGREREFGAVCSLASLQLTVTSRNRDDTSPSKSVLV